MINLFDKYKEDAPQLDVKRRKKNRIKYRRNLLTCSLFILYAIIIGRLYIGTSQQQKVGEFLKAQIKKLYKEIDNYTDKQQMMYENLTQEVTILWNQVHVLLNDGERKPTVKSDSTVGEWTDDFEFELNRLKNWTNWLEKRQEDYDEKLYYIFSDLDRLDGHINSGATVLHSEDKMPQLKTESANKTIKTRPAKGNRASRIRAIQYSVDKLDAKMTWLYNKLKERGLL